MNIPIATVIMKMMMSPTIYLFTERILAAYQSVSDFFIAMAYSSIPIQLFLFHHLFKISIQMPPLEIHSLHCILWNDTFT